MRIVVILGRVLDPAGIVVNRRVNRIFINRETYMMQPADRCALEAALRIQDSLGAEVVALPRTVLPDDDVLRQALAMGADRAIGLIDGDGAASADTCVTVRLIQAAIERLGGADLVLTGAATLDTGQQQLGSRLAEALGWPQISEAWRVDVAAGQVRAVRQAAGSAAGGDAGFTLWAADLPAVVTVVAGALKPRYPDGVRLINVYRGVGEIAARLESWAVSDLVSADELVPLLELRGQTFAPERERRVRAAGSPEEMAQTAAAALAQRIRR